MNSMVPEIGNILLNYVSTGKVEGTSRKNWEEADWTMFGLKEAK